HTGRHTPPPPLKRLLPFPAARKAPPGGACGEGPPQPFSSTALRGIDPADADKVERLIADTIGGLADRGIDPLTVEAALNTVEFQLRENNTGAFPRGIAFMLRALRSWLHGRDPLTPLAFAAPLSAIKGRVAGGERYFENQ